MGNLLVYSVLMECTINYQLLVAFEYFSGVSFGRAIRSYSSIFPSLRSINISGVTAAIPNPIRDKAVIPRRNDKGICNKLEKPLLRKAKKAD